MLGEPIDCKFFTDEPVTGFPGCHCNHWGFRTTCHLYLGLTDGMDCRDRTPTKPQVAAAGDPRELRTSNKE